MLEQLYELAVKVNWWCDLTIICGWIGFALSLTAAIMFWLKCRKEMNDDN